MTQDFEPDALSNKESTIQFDLLLRLLDNCQNLFERGPNFRISPCAPENDVFQDWMRDIFWQSQLY
jgi:hypothetical protein